MAPVSVEFRWPNWNPKGANRREETISDCDARGTRFGRDHGAVLSSQRAVAAALVSLIQSASEVVETVIHEIGVRTLETMLSAEEVAGPRRPGKGGGEVRHYGSQPGRIRLADRKVKVKRPRLRHKTKGEVEVPADAALQRDRGLGEHLPGARLRGLSTRTYREILPQMAETVGVSRSSISREAIEASEEQLKQLQERRWDQVEILVIYIDGQRFAEHHLISAVGRGCGGQQAHPGPRARGHGKRGSGETAADALAGSG